MGVSIRSLIDYAWLTVGIIWLLSAFGTKRAVRQYIGPSRIVQIVLLVLAFLLVFSRYSQIGFLGWRVIPPSQTSSIAGAALVFAGLLLALWARFFLGRNWSGEITVKQDHELVRSGPYAVVRHPIYSGFLLGLLGTAIAIGQVRCFVGLILATIGWRLKSLVEEQFMAEQFGAQYTSYRRDVKALIPFIW